MDTPFPAWLERLLYDWNQSDDGGVVRSMHLQIPDSVEMSHASSDISKLGLTALLSQKQKGEKSLGAS
jgi:hypothetical protein